MTHPAVTATEIDCPISTDIPSLSWMTNVTPDAASGFASTSEVAALVRRAGDAAGNSGLAGDRLAQVTRPQAHKPACGRLLALRAANADVDAEQACGAGRTDRVGDDLGRNDNAASDELRHHRRRRLAIEFLRRRQLHQPAAVHHRDTVRERHRLGLVVSDVEHRGSGPLVELRELVLHGPPQMNVEIGKRLVEKHEGGRRHEAAGERDALALSAGEHGRVAVAHVRQADEGEGVADAAGALGLRQAGDLQPVSDVLRDRHVRPESIGLKHDADVAPLRRHVHPARRNSLRSD